jgi:hypothetical protein
MMHAMPLMMTRKFVDHVDVFYNSKMVPFMNHMVWLIYLLKILFQATIYAFLNDHMYFVHIL